jgi:hypothetical protein
MSEAVEFLKTEGFTVGASTTLAEIEDQWFDALHSVQLGLHLQEQFGIACIPWINDWAALSPLSTLEDYVSNIVGVASLRRS